MSTQCWLESLSLHLESIWLNYALIIATLSFSHRILLKFDVSKTILLEGFWNAHEAGRRCLRCCMEGQEKIRRQVVCYEEGMTLSDSFRSNLAPWRKRRGRMQSTRFVYWHLWMANTSSVIRMHFMTRPQEPSMLSWNMPVEATFSKELMNTREKEPGSPNKKFGRHLYTWRKVSWVKFRFEESAWLQNIASRFEMRQCFHRLWRSLQAGRPQRFESVEARIGSYPNRHTLLC